MSVDPNDRFTTWHNQRIADLEEEVDELNTKLLAIQHGVLISEQERHHEVYSYKWRHYSSFDECKACKLALEDLGVSVEGLFPDL